jgi:ribonucleoside-triphosphate reductase
MGHIKREAERLSAKHKVRFVLADSADEMTAHRLARQDLRSPYEDQARHIVSGDAAGGDVYYTGPCKALPRARINALERVRIEGLLQELGVFGVTTPIWLGEHSTAFEPLAALISRAFYQTHAASILPAPEFTICLSCGQSSRGLHSICVHCQSQRVDGLAVSTHHFSRISTWNRGLLVQLRDRYRVDENLE